jgi:Zn-dependent protease
LWITQSFLINIILGLFNLLPIPPLDGGRIAVGFLPLSIAKRWAKLEKFGLLIVMGLLFSGVLNKILLPAILIAEKVMKSVGFGL